MQRITEIFNHRRPVCPQDFRRRRRAEMNQNNKPNARKKIAPNSKIIAVLTSAISMAATPGMCCRSQYRFTGRPYKEGAVTSIYLPIMRKIRTETKVKRPAVFSNRPRELPRLINKIMTRASIDISGSNRIHGVGQILWKLRHALSARTVPLSARNLRVPLCKRCR